jgi:hypothetical protein
MAKLTWDPNPESYVAGYNVYRSLQSGNFGSTPLNGATPIATTAFTDATLQSGVTYYYVVRATTVDGIESPNSSELQAVIPAANRPPGVVGGADQTVLLPASVTLAAAGSDDGLPNGMLTYRWSVVSGGSVAFSNPDSAITSASIAAAGTYTLRVTVSDGQYSASDDVQITVKSGVTNKAPLVTAGPNITVKFPAQAFLSATATDDGLPGGPLSYGWSVASGSGVTLSSPGSASTAATFSAPGKYVLRVAASDGALTSTAEVTVDVLGSEQLTLFVSKGGEVLRGSITSITAGYQDPRVDNLALYINSSKVLSVDSQSLKYRWDLRKLSGRYTVQARAYDSSNVLLAEQAVTVTVK